MGVRMVEVLVKGERVAQSFFVGGSPRLLEHWGCIEEVFYCFFVIHFCFWDLLHDEVPQAFRLVESPSLPDETQSACKINKKTGNDMVLHKQKDVIACFCLS